MKSLNTLKSLELNERENVPNPVFLAFYQASLRLRHLTQIVGYNLNGLSDCTSLYTNPLPSYLPLPEIKNGYYFTLEVPSHIEPDYKSNLQPSTSPNWESFDCKEVFPVELLSLKGIIVKVWLKENENEKLITSWGVNFSGLVPLSLKTPPPYEYAPNTLLFKLRGRYYTSYDCILKTTNDEEKNVFELHQGFSVSLSDRKDSYCVSSLCRFWGNQHELRKEEKKKEELRKSLESKIIKKQSKAISLEKKIESLKIIVNLLMNQLEVEMNKLRSIKLAADNLDCSNQDKGTELLGKYQTLNKLISSLKSQKSAMVNENESVQNLISQVKDRRCQLLSQLNLIFPIEHNENSSIKYSICNTPLPDAESPEWNSDQSLSVSLGYVSQLFVKIAFLINIPLKYPITLRGSLSSIADLTSTQLLDVEPQFPLYTRGKEREKLHFNYGVFLLNKNIAQLRWNCGLSTSNLRPTLFNTWHLLKSLHDQSFATRAVMPDTVVSSLVFPESLRQKVQTPVSLLQHQTPRLPLNPVNPKVYQSLPDTPLSPRSRPRKKGSLDDDSFLCTASDTEIKVERNTTNGEISECDEKTVLLTSTNYLHSRSKELQQQNYDKVIKLKQASCSLDQGMNFIKNDKQEIDFLINSLASSMHDLNITKTTSGSFPSIPKKVEEENNDLPLSRFHEQTTQLLKSWHENSPSPYHSITVGSNSSEKLETLNTHNLLLGNEESVVEKFSISNQSRSFNHDKSDNQIIQYDYQITESDKQITSSDNKIIDSDNQITNILVNNSKELECDKSEKQEEENEKTNELNNINDKEEFVKRTSELVKELGISLEDLDIGIEDTFLRDVASRTANLASQNCSFKFSFSRPSSGEE